MTTTHLPHLPLELWLEIFAYINTTTLWRARILSATLKSNIEAYFYKVFLPRHVHLSDHTMTSNVDSASRHFSHYSHDNQIVWFAMKRPLVRREEHKQLEVELFSVGADYEQGETKDIGRVVVGATLKLPSRKLVILHDRWRAVENVDIERGVAGAEECSKTKEPNVYFDQGRRFVGFDWRLLLTRILLHPDMNL